MKRIFESRPVLPHYSSTWDVGQVLTCLQGQSLQEWSLQDLTLKTTIIMLLCLLTGQRTQLQTLAAIDSANLVLVPDIKVDYLYYQGAKHFQAWQALYTPLAVLKIARHESRNTDE